MYYVISRNDVTVDVLENVTLSQAIEIFESRYGKGRVSTAVCTDAEWGTLAEYPAIVSCYQNNEEVVEYQMILWHSDLD